MPAFYAPTLDPSRIRVEDIIPALSYDELRLRYVDAFLRAWNELRAKHPDLPAYDVETLRSDPVAVVGEAGSYLRTLERAAFDDRVRALLLGSATGAALDHIGTTYYGVARMIVPADPVTGAAEVRERDDRYTLRLQLAPEAGLPRAQRRGAKLGAAKTLGGYVFHALSCDLRVRTADAASLARGTVHVAVLAEDGEDPDVVAGAVRAWLSREDVKGATDIVEVAPALVLTVDLAALLFVPHGPDGDAIKATAEAGYRRFVAARGPFRAPLYGTAIDAALQAPGVETVTRTAPATDVLAPFGTVIRAGAVALDVQRVGAPYG